MSTWRVTLGAYARSVLLILAVATYPAASWAEDGGGTKPTPPVTPPPQPACDSVHDFIIRTNCPMSSGLAKAASCAPVVEHA